MALELRDRVVESGPAHQAMLSEGSDHANPTSQNNLTKLKPVRRLVWRCTSEPERDKSVFGVASMSRPSGFRGNETGHARANVQSPHLRLL